MAKKISSFYEDELNGWLDSLKFYQDEAHSLENSLEEVISRNTIIDIAAKVEVHQLILNKSVNKIRDLQIEIEAMKSEILSGSVLTDDKLITKEIENRMKLIALNFKHAEQEFIDVKYYCNEFLIDILKK